MSWAKKEEKKKSHLPLKRHKHRFLNKYQNGRAEKQSTPPTRKQRKHSNLSDRGCRSWDITMVLYSIHPISIARLQTEIEKSLTDVSFEN